MPKEYIGDTRMAYTDDGKSVPLNENRVKVGWNREAGFVQIATVNPEGETACSGSSDDPKDLLTASKELRNVGCSNVGKDERATKVYYEWERSIEFEENGGDCVKVEGGWYVDLGRREINELIRVLRRARDQAFGRDE